MIIEETKCTTMLELKQWLNGMSDTELRTMDIMGPLDKGDELHLTIFDTELSDGSKVRDCAFRFPDVDWGE